MSLKVLNAKQVEFYHEQGYLLAKGVVPKEALDLAQTVLERWVDETIQSWVDSGLLDDPMREVDFGHRLAQVWEAAGHPHYIRSPRRDLISPELFDFIRHPAILNVAQDLLGTPEILAHGIFNARPKLPDQKWTDTPWHQDAQYYRDAELVHVLTIWIPLQAVTENNSCLQVAPGYHQGQLYEGYNDAETGFLGLSKEDRAALKGLPISMERGDALCFTQLTPHGALPNHSDAVRWSMDMRYEATPTATESGKKQGFVARSEENPDSVTSYEEWLTKWEQIPAGSY
ncbi:MAG: phytanoyl-CoA dioxygenase family protein [Anaerolineae bacterium]|nr:phytanoyl-CoA dioxygenase family protein [Anaerolineae bacterium]